MRRSNYDKFPYVEVNGKVSEGIYACEGWEAIGKELRQAVSGKDRAVVCVDLYHGVWEVDVLEALKTVVKPDAVFCTAEANKSTEDIQAMLAYNTTDDRVFGILSHHTIDAYFDMDKVAAMKQRIAEAKGLILVYGIGAALCCEPDLLVYADMARWEIQLRMRTGKMGNWLTDNAGEDQLRKYKRAFFIDWRVLDRHKQNLYQRMDYVLDTNDADHPKMMTGDAFRAGLKQASVRPFRVKPYFDPCVWGGQWMKEVCDLDREKPNFAWSFDCVPEENSLLMKVGDVILETPAINLVFTEPVALLGDKVHARFGKEFPIRFDMLDTMDGQNLSLQVHPLTEYIQDKFGMHYTQDESYYILDAVEESHPNVYLGFRTGIDKAEFEHVLRESQTTGQFDAERFVNKLPAHKHDHFLIPAGTIHCSGKDCMVLEISATPYIFTFKLWDWGRLGLDGKPRPIHVDHGLKNIQFDRNTEWVMDNLAYRVDPISEEDGVREERTGLHEREFIETRRHWFDKPVTHNTNGGVNVLNLVEGEEAIVTSPIGAFDPYVVHYAESFIVPAAVGEYTIAPYGASEGKKIATLKAYVRT